MPGPSRASAELRAPQFQTTFDRKNIADRNVMLRQITMESAIKRSKFDQRRMIEICYGFR